MNLHSTLKGVTDALRWTMRGSGVHTRECQLHRESVHLFAGIWCMFDLQHNHYRMCIPICD
jgi:hypothetical protein